MTLSVWRYAHLVLALIASVFLIILSVTGTILAYDAIQERATSSSIHNLDQITLSQSINGLRLVYPEIIQLSIDHNNQVAIEALDDDGNTIQGYIDPISGEILSEIKPKSDFINWTTALHRSLFLKETGRILVAIVSFLLFLITISGTALILKRQQGLRNFFSKIHQDFFAQYFHVVSGRLLLIPILLISLSATYIYISSLKSFQGEVIIKNFKVNANLNPTKIEDVDLFKNTALSQIKKVEFPFIPDDPNEHFYIHLHDKELEVSQINGQIISQKILPIQSVIASLNLDIHTGRTNILWAIILGLASINILFFIYSGFYITLKRRKNKIKNSFQAHQANIIILVGTENGSTLFFANKIKNALIEAGKSVYLGQLNDYQIYPKAQHLLVFTSTYGLGTAPDNANKFLELVERLPQKHTLKFSVVGFGSKSYPDFCAFAKKTHRTLMQQEWSEILLPPYFINDKSAEEFVQWVKDFNAKTQLQLPNISTHYTEKLSDYVNFIVMQKTSITGNQHTFSVTLQPEKKVRFQSGDLIAIYPQNNHIQRLYSIGKIDNKIQLMVKLFPDGIGSNFLYNLKENQSFKARIISNSTFHIPAQSRQIAMIGNGTGIAPFLGMIDENHSKKMRLFIGLRYQDYLAQHYLQVLTEQIKSKKLDDVQWAFSRGIHPQYVMDLVRKNSAYFVELLTNNGTIMICGSLQMQQNIEAELEKILESAALPNLHHFKSNGQILADCY